MVKLLNRFTTAPKKNLRKKVGQVTEEFIADAREDLKQQKKRPRKRKHDGTLHIISCLSRDKYMFNMVYFQTPPEVCIYI